MQHARAIRFQNLLCRYSFATTLTALFAIAVLSLGPLGHLGGSEGVEITLHILLYAIAVLPVSAAPIATYYWASLLALLLGLVLEFLQPAVGLDANLGNLIANSVGIMIGFLLGRAIQLALGAAERSR